MWKRTINTVLLGFVAASLGYLVIRSLQAARDWRSPVVAQALTQVPELDAAGQRTKVVAYYFHVTVRCTTCRNIEAYSKETVQERFADELSNGNLEWRLVNVQLPENRHYIQRYQLFTKSLVLVRYDKGKEKEFKVLNDTWELVDDKLALQRYVESEVRALLGKNT